MNSSDVAEVEELSYPDGGSYTAEIIIISSVLGFHLKQ